MSTIHSEVDLEQLDQLRQNHLGRLLLRTYRAFSSRAVKKLGSKGYEGISLASTMLLMNIDAQGIQLTRLGEKTGISRQATANLIQAMEKKKYVARSPDPTDKRAVIVSLTSHGWKLIKDIVEIKAEIEKEYRSIIGNDQMKQFKKNLLELLEVVDNN